MSSFGEPRNFTKKGMSLWPTTTSMFCGVSKMILVRAHVASNCNHKTRKKYVTCWIPRLEKNNCTTKIYVFIPAKQ
jgi:hypothetical protein